MANRREWMHVLAFLFPNKLSARKMSNKTLNCSRALRSLQIAHDASQRQAIIDVLGIAAVSRFFAKAVLPQAAQQGMTSTMIAARKGYWEVLKRHAQGPFGPVICNACDSYGYSPLSWALYNNSGTPAAQEACRATLMAAPEAVQRVNGEGMTVLHSLAWGKWGESPGNTRLLGEVYPVPCGVSLLRLDFLLVLRNSTYILNSIIKHEYHL